MTRNTFMTLAILVVAWIILPTGDPTDLIVVVFLIDRLGLEVYTLLSIGILIVLYNNVQGKGVSGKVNTVKKELRAAFG